MGAGAAGGVAGAVTRDYGPRGRREVAWCTKNRGRIGRMRVKKSLRELEL